MADKIKKQSHKKEKEYPAKRIKTNEKQHYISQKNDVHRQLDKHMSCLITQSQALSTPAFVGRNSSFVFNNSVATNSEVHNSSPVFYFNPSTAGNLQKGQMTNITHKTIPPGYKFIPISSCSVQTNNVKKPSIVTPFKKSECPSTITSTEQLSNALDANETNINCKQPIPPAVSDPIFSISNDFSLDTTPILIAENGISSHELMSTTPIIIANEDGIPPQVTAGTDAQITPPSQGNNITENNSSTNFETDDVESVVSDGRDGSIGGINEDGNYGGDNLSDTEHLHDQAQRNGRATEGGNLQQILHREKTTHDSDHCCGACRNLLLILMRKMDELKLITLNSTVNNNKNGAGAVHGYSKLSNLPINDIGTLNAFDKNLVKNDPNNLEMKLQFENKVSSIGGNDAKKAVANILPEIVTDQLATRLVWTIKVEGKTPIENYNFPSILARIISSKYKCDQAAVKDRIKLWIQKAGDRIRAATKKKERIQQLNE